MVNMKAPFITKTQSITSQNTISTSVDSSNFKVKKVRKISTSARIITGTVFRAATPSLLNRAVSDEFLNCDANRVFM